VDTLLKVNRLSTSFLADRGRFCAVDDISFSVKKGQTVGLVGESGCGKSITSLSLLRMIEPPGKIETGEIWFDGRDLMTLDEPKMRRVRGNEMSMIFQEPMNSLNPVFTIGNQIGEVFRIHQDLSSAESKNKTIEMLKLVNIPSPEKRVNDYPHHLSGGMRQRVMIAMALACHPKLLIADEPTTALDVTVQAQILTLMGRLQEELGMSILFITHDLGVVAEICDFVLVMYAGKIIESGPVSEVFANASHPYTMGLLASAPRLGKRQSVLPTVRGSIPSLWRLPKGCRFSNRCFYAKDICHTQEPGLEELSENSSVACWFAKELRANSSASKSQHLSSIATPKNIDEKKDNDEILRVQNLKKFYPVKSVIMGRTLANVRAVDDVSFSVRRGETLGLVGESGCGKSTLARTLLRFYEPTEGQVYFEGEDLASLSSEEMRKKRRNIQMIFQDPISSLNPRMKIGSILYEPFFVHSINNKEVITRTIQHLLEKVGLKEEALNLYPHEFSGGQRQRICIARALSLNPKFIVCDEPVSALDVSIRSQILNLLVALREEYKLTYLFISHDLAVIEHISDRIAVMYLGKIVELSLNEDLFSNPRHPYTRALMEAIPRTDSTEGGKRLLKRSKVISGDVPSSLDPPSGCHFHPRCPLAKELCRREAPVLRNLGSEDRPHWVSCHYA
jgi:peptide/nickel transport system ATP-binding protein